MASENRCPHCGHHRNVHSGPNAEAPTYPVGTCFHDPMQTPCACPGWPQDQSSAIIIATHPRPGRIARPRGKGTNGRPGTGYVSPMSDETDWDDAA